MRNHQISARRTNRTRTRLHRTLLHVPDGVVHKNLTKTFNDWLSSFPATLSWPRCHMEPYVLRRLRSTIDDDDDDDDIRLELRERAKNSHDKSGNRAIGRNDM